MFSRHRVTRPAIELIKRFEGYRRNAAQLPDGRWTIGYGHTLTAREGAEVSEADAEALLLYDLISIAHAVNENVYAPISQNQFDALCSFAFNLGIDNFRGSQVLKRLNAGAAVQAACAMELWRKADFEGERIVVDALVRRRAAEKALFLTPAGDVWVPAPSPILRPVIDLDAQDLIPLRRPVELETSLEGDRVVVRREGPPEGDAEPAPEPPPAVAMAGESVRNRLETLFADPGEEPEASPEPPPEPTPTREDGPAEELLVEPELRRQEARPEADFAPPITVDYDDPLVEEGPPEPFEAPLPEFEAEVEPEAHEPTPAADEELEIPQAPRPQEAAFTESQAEMQPFELIPARKRPTPQPKEASVVWDLLLALFGLAFFGFGIFWGLNAAPGITPAAGFITPLLVAWLAGLAGVGFVVVSVFRLLQRLGREVERD